MVLGNFLILGKWGDSVDDSGRHYLWVFWEYAARVQIMINYLMGMTDCIFCLTFQCVKLIFRKINFLGGYLHIFQIQTSKRTSIEILNIFSSVIRANRPLTSQIIPDDSFLRYPEIQCLPNFFLRMKLFTGCDLQTFIKSPFSILDLLLQISEKILIFLGISFSLY